MKQNKVKLYAKALAEVAMNEKENKKSVENFLALVKKNNLERKLKEIVDLAEEIILTKKGNKKIVFETARNEHIPRKYANIMLSMNIDRTNRLNMLSIVVTIFQLNRGSYFSVTK